jgi:hypothetical protein
MRDYFYILDGQRRVRPVADASAWREWIAAHFADRQVAVDDVGDVHVSTIFLGLNSVNEAGDPPLVFETSVVGGRIKHLLRRSSTWEQAEAVHREVVERVKASLEP